MVATTQNKGSWILNNTGSITEQSGRPGPCQAAVAQFHAFSGLISTPLCQERQAATCIESTGPEVTVSRSAAQYQPEHKG